MEISVSIEFYYIKVYINKLLHICILNNQFVGFNSYEKNSGSYVIVFITKTNKFKVEYDQRDKWVSVLKELENKL